MVQTYHILVFWFEAWLIKIVPLNALKRMNFGGH